MKAPVAERSGSERAEELGDRFVDALSYATRVHSGQLRGSDSLDDASGGALLVSLADKLDNTRSMIRGYRIRGAEQWERTGKTPEEVHWYYGRLAERFCRLRPGPLANELARTVSELDRLLDVGNADDGR